MKIKPSTVVFLFLSLLLSLPSGAAAEPNLNVRGHFSDVDDSYDISANNYDFLDYSAAEPFVEPEIIVIPEPAHEAPPATQTRAEAQDFFVTDSREEPAEVLPPQAVNPHTLVRQDQAQAVQQRAASVIDQLRFLTASSQQNEPVVEPTPPPSTTARDDLLEDLKQKINAMKAD